MIIAVTGSSGFLGSNLIKALGNTSHEIIEIDIASGFDVTDFAKAKSIKKFDVCVYLAANTFVPESYKKPHDFYSTNLFGLLNYIELCRIYDAKIIFVSSYVYGKPKYLPIDEKHPIDGCNPYAETKIIGESICANYNKYFGVKTVILRPFNIFGYGQSKNFLIPSIFHQAKSGQVILNDPVPKRDFIHVDDVTNLILNVIENRSLTYEIFNIGSGKSYSVDYVANLIRELSKHSFEIEYSASPRKSEIDNTIADISKAKKILGWEPHIDLHNGLRRITDA